MSSFVWMKVLESSAERFDRGMAMLSGGHMAEVYDRIAELGVPEGGSVLDVGCGTGGVALACVRRGADVLGIDVNADMLEVARRKPVPAGGHVRWLQCGIGEIVDLVGEHQLDAVVGCLVMSELGEQEQGYLLRVAASRLRPGGRLVLADEVPPPSAGARLWHRVTRAPMVALTWVLTQTSTRPVAGLAERVQAAGFVDVVEEPGPIPAFAVISARVAEEAP